MITPLPAISRFFQAVTQISWRGEQYAQLTYDPQPPVEGCPINSLPFEILSHIFQLGHQMDLEPDPSLVTDPVSDSGHEQDYSPRVHRDPARFATLNDPDADEPFPPPEPIPVIDDGQNNSDWEDEDTDQDSDDDDLSTQLLVDNSFQVTVSHVCKHWRKVALATAVLWSEIDVETGRQAAPSYLRASTYLSRTNGCPLSISIDVDEWPSDDESVYSEQSDCPSPGTSAQLQKIMDLLLPHTSRWRDFKLTADDYYHFHAVMSQLCDAPPADLLESLELHHLDEEIESGPSHFPYHSHKTPFILFGNRAPKLCHVSLYGVHIDWHNTTFLKDLHFLELAYHSQDVRPSFNEFFTILRSSLELRTLDLCMAGPVGPPHDWPTFLPQKPQVDHYHDPHVPAPFATQPDELDEYMTLPKLHELKLSYQSPEELAAFFDRVSMPSLHTLELHFDDHEYTDFIHSRLIAPPKWQGASSRESRLVNLKELRIAQLPCTPNAIANLYAALANLEIIVFDFDYLDQPFWEVLVPMGPLHGLGPPARQLLPALHTMKAKGSTGDILRQIVQARIDVGLPLKKLLIDLKSGIDEYQDEWLRENVEGIEYFEASDDDYTDDDDESVSGVSLG